MRPTKKNQPANPHSLITLRCQYQETASLAIQNMSSEEILIRLRECAVRSESSLGAHVGVVRFPTLRFIYVSFTDRSKAVVPVLVLLFVALWFILRGDLLYVFPCVILFLCFSALLVLRLPRLGKRELILVLFVRLFGLCLFRFVGFLFLLGSGKGCGL